MSRELCQRITLKLARYARRTPRSLVFLAVTTSTVYRFSSWKCPHLGKGIFGYLFDRQWLRHARDFRLPIVNLGPSPVPSTLSGVRALLSYGHGGSTPRIVVLYPKVSRALRNSSPALPRAAMCQIGVRHQSPIGRPQGLHPTKEASLRVTSYGNDDSLGTRINRPRKPEESGPYPKPTDILLQSRGSVDSRAWRIGR